MSNRALITAIFVWSLALSPSIARADFYTHLWEDQHQPHGALKLAPELTYYRTESNYDAVGDVAVPTGFKGYSRFQTDVSAAFGMNPFITIYGRMNWARGQIEHDTIPGDVFGFGDQTAGATIRAWRASPQSKLKGWGFDVQAQVDFPAYSNLSSNNLGTHFLGDGSLDITSGGFLTLPVPLLQSERWLFRGGVGYTWRSASFSSAIPWSATIKYSSKGEGVFFSGTLAGFRSLKTDANGAIGLTAAGTTGAGGSFITNAINPSLFLAKAQLGYQFDDNLGFHVSASQALIGQASPSGLTVSLGLQARWWRGGGVQKNPSRMTAPEYGKPNQGFVNYAFESRIIKTSERLGQVKIDKGTQDGVAINQVFDIFVVKQDGSLGEAIARAKVVQVQSNESNLTVTEYYKEVWIEEGYIAKRPLQ